VPLSGQKVNLLDPKDYLEGIGGIAFLLLIAGGGYYAYRKFQGATSGTMIGNVTALPSRGGVPVKFRQVAY